VFETVGATRMSINEQAKWIEGEGKMILKNPLNEEIDAAQINFFLKAYIEFGFNAEDDFNLNIKLANLDTTITDVLPHFASEETVESMQGKIDAIERILNKTINSYTSTGIKLPIPSKMQRDLGGARLIP